MTTAPPDRCATCDGPMPAPAPGRRSAPRYCSNACRQRAYRQRRTSVDVGAGSSMEAQARMSSFVGRTDELVELGRLIAGGRLVTLTGPPGSGKTRLAIEAASAQQRTGRTAAGLVELDGAADPREVRERITAELARTSSAGRADRGARLLVLDGCDHLLDACGRALNEAFSQCPDLRVLATSRESLRHPGEVVYPIAGLPVPGDDTDATPAELLRSPAVRLFADRARAVKPDFRLTAANAGRIGALCARLDGLPLAIELAARLVRAFPVATIHDQLDEAPLNLLTGGWRTAASRHQSLRAAVDWSHDLLTDDEQRLFRALAEAPGGFEPDMAAALTATAVQPRAVPALLASLEAKSLITALPDETGDARFRMLESLRCFARERLEDVAEQDTVRERAAAWFVMALGAFDETGVLSRHRARRLARERANIDHTLAWLRAGDDPRQVPLVAAVEALDMIMGTPTARPPVLASVLSRADPLSGYHRGALSAQAVLTAWRGLDDRARLLADQVRTGASRTGDDAQLARMETLLDLLRRPGSGPAAVRRLRHCLGTSRLQDDMPMAALSLHLLARQVLVTGETEHMAEPVDEALTVARDETVPGPLRPLLMARGALALQAGEQQQATSCFTALLHAAAGHPLWSAGALEGFALAAARDRAYERALKLLAAAEELRPTVPEVPATGVWWQRQVNAVRTSVIEAVPHKYVEAAFTSGRTLTSRQATDYALDTSVPTGEEPLSRASLSEREWQVAVLVSQGLTNRQIGDRMYLSTRTVDTHIRNIRTTLGLGSRAQIAAWIVEATPRRSAG